MELCNNAIIVVYNYYAICNNAIQYTTKVKWPNFGHRLFPVTSRKTRRPGKKELSPQQPLCCLCSGNIPLPEQQD